jgi:hypothetical protein
LSAWCGFFDGNLTPPASVTYFTTIWKDGRKAVKSERGWQMNDKLENTRTSPWETGEIPGSIVSRQTLLLVFAIRFDRKMSLQTTRRFFGWTRHENPMTIDFVFLSVTQI